MDVMLLIWKRIVAELAKNVCCITQFLLFLWKVISNRQNPHFLYSKCSNCFFIQLKVIALTCYLELAYISRMSCHVRTAVFQNSVETHVTIVRQVLTITIYIWNLRNIFPKSFEALKWHWLILAPIGALVYDK